MDLQAPLRAHFGFLSPERGAEEPLSSPDPTAAGEACAVCAAAGSEGEAPWAPWLAPAVDASPDCASDLKGIIFQRNIPCLPKNYFQNSIHLGRLN